MRTKLIVALICVFVVAFSLPALAPVQYQLKHKHVLGGDGGWDYLTYDPAGKRLFISRGTHVMVVDPEKGTVLGDIPDTAGVHGIALAPDLGKGFTSNGRDNTVTVFDLKTLKETAKIKTEGGENPDAIMYDAFSKRVFAFNGRSKNATVIDAVTDKLVGNIPLNGKPEFAVADGKGLVFVNIEDTSELTSINAAKAAVAHTWKITGCEEPSGLDMDVTHRRLFAGCHNKVMAVINADDGKVVATVPIGEGVDANAFDPGTQLAFSSNGDGTLTVVHEDSPDKYTVVQNAETQKFARTMALDTNNHNVYLVTAEIEIVPPAKEGDRPSRKMKPGTFTLLVMAEADAAKPAAPPKKTADAKPAEPAKKASTAPQAAAAVASPESAALYKSKCQICHGADGKGSAAGQKMGAKDFHAPEVAKQSDAELFDAVKKGKGKMTAFAGKLTDDQIKGLIAYIRTLK
ncbi:MAG: c-type cytochrome [Acidobacteriia bacterium]|nr:c-type cytochrome [Terriglobia bacterium]